MASLCKECGEPLSGRGPVCPSCLRRRILHESGKELVVEGARANMAVRAAAWFFDYSLLTLLAFAAFSFERRRFEMRVGQEIMLAVSRTLTATYGPSQFSLSGSAAVMITILGAVYAISCLFGLFYYVLFEWALRGTPGKMIAGLSVTNFYDQSPSLLRALGRYLGRFLFVVPLALLVLLSYRRPDYAEVSGNLFLLASAALLVTTFGLALFTRRGQTLHDWLSGCHIQEARIVETSVLAVLVIAALAILGGVILFLPEELLPSGILVWLQQR